MMDAFSERVYRRSHSEKSVNTYNSALRTFEKFCQEKYKTNTIKLTEDLKNRRLDVYRVLDDFVAYLDASHKSTNTIYTYYTGVKKYFWHHQIEIYTEKAKENVVLPTKSEILDGVLTREIITRVLNQCSPKLRAMILVLLSSGMRLGEALSLRVRDIEFSSRPARIVIPARFTKNNRQRETYITTEAAQALKDYLQYKITRLDEHILTYTDNLHAAESDAERLFRTTMRKLSDLDGIIEGSNNRHNIHLHSFRKFFFTISSDIIGAESAHALMGHSFYMKTYYRKNLEERREMYLRLEPYLTIFNADKIRKEIEVKHTIQSKQIEELTAKLERATLFTDLITPLLTSKNKHIILTDPEGNELAKINLGESNPSVL